MAHAEAVHRVRSAATDGPPPLPSSLDVKAELGHLGANMPLDAVIRLCQALTLPLRDVLPGGGEPTQRLPALRL
ncbi:MAG: hypothetical protein WCJ30_08595 [Deltaproteobacteria bacterium]